MLENTTAFVTGASRGIGREIAVTLAEHGASVGLAARSDGIYETASKIGDDAALPIECDVAEEQSVRDAIDATVDAFGGLDCLVNNAGISGPTAPVEDISIEEFERTLRVNVGGAFLCAKHAAPYLRRSDQASIANISSIGGKKPYPNRTPYAASKMAMIGLGRTLAFELGDDGVTVNTICPGPVVGDRIESVIEAQAEKRGWSFERARDELYTGDLALGEMVHPNEIAECVAFLASDHGRHTTAQDLNIGSGGAWY